MFETLFTARFSKTLGIGVIAGATLAVASVSSNAADQIQPPPYLTAGMSVVSVSVVWDEAAIRESTSIWYRANKRNDRRYQYHHD